MKTKAQRLETTAQKYLQKLMIAKLSIPTTVLTPQQKRVITTHTNRFSYFDKLAMVALTQGDKHHV